MDHYEIMFQSNVNGSFPWPLAHTVAEGEGNVILNDTRFGEIFSSGLSTDLKKSRDLSGVSCIHVASDAFWFDNTRLRFNISPDLETNLDRKLWEELELGMIVICFQEQEVDENVCLSFSSLGSCTLKGPVRVC